MATTSGDRHKSGGHQNQLWKYQQSVPRERAWVIDWQPLSRDMEVINKRGEPDCLRNTMPVSWQRSLGVPKHRRRFGLEIWNVRWDSPQHQLCKSIMMATAYLMIRTTPRDTLMLLGHVSGSDEGR